MKIHTRLLFLFAFLSLYLPQIQSQSINYSVSVSKNWVPVIVNGEKLLESQDIDSIIEPIYRFKDPISKQFKLKQTFRYAEPFRSNGLAIAAFSGDQDYVLIDTTGKTIFKGPFQIVELKNDQFIISKKSIKGDQKNTQYGIVNQSGKIIIEPKYQNIEYLNEPNYYLVETTNKKFGVIDMNGNSILEPIWDKIEFESAVGLLVDWQKERTHIQFSNYYQKMLNFYKIPFFIILNDKSMGSIRKMENGSYQFTYLVDGENETPMSDEIKIEDGEAFLITQYREKGKFAYRLKNLMGQIIFQTPFYSKKESEKIEGEIHFPNSFQIYRSQFEDKILITIAKPGKSHVFDVHLMDFEGKVEFVLKKTKYFPVANMLNEWLVFMDLKLIQENKDSDEINLKDLDIKAYHPNWGMVEKVFSFDTFGKSDYILAQNKKFGFNLFTNKVNHVIPIEVKLKKQNKPLLASDVQILDHFLLLNINQNQWLYEVNTQKLEHIGQYQIIDKHKLLYVDSKNGQLYLKIDSNKSRLMNINYPFNFQTEFKKNFDFYFDGKFVKIKYADTNFFFDFQGNLIVKKLEEITQTLSPDMHSKYLAFYFQEPEQVHSELMGYPHLKLKNISGSLCDNGSLIDQDLDGNVWFFPYKFTNLELFNHSNGTFPKPIFIKKDSAFDYFMFNPGYHEELDISDRISTTSGKTKFEIVYSDKNHEFWIILDKEIVFKGNYKGEFLNGCSQHQDFEYMGKDIWLEPSTPIAISNQMGTYYLFNAFLNEDGSTRGYKIDSIHIPTNAAFVLNSYEYFMIYLDLDEEAKEYIKSYKHIYWLLNKKKEVIGIWNNLSRSWILNPKEHKTASVFAHNGFSPRRKSSYTDDDLFILLLEKDSNPAAIYQTVKTIDGKKLLDIPASYETRFFHEDPYLGSFLEINNSQGIQMSYRINAKYEFKRNNYQLSAIKEKWHAFFTESADTDSYFNQLDDDYFQIHLNLKQIIPVYYDQNGQLFWEN